MRPALRRLPDLPGAMLTLGECRYSIVWLVEPEPLARDEEVQERPPHRLEQ